MTGVVSRVAPVVRVEYLDDFDVDGFDPDGRRGGLGFELWMEDKDEGWRTAKEKRGSEYEYEHEEGSEQWR